MEKNFVYLKENDFKNKSGAAVVRLKKMRFYSAAFAFLENAVGYCIIRPFVPLSRPSPSLKHSGDL